MKINRDQRYDEKRVRLNISFTKSEIDLFEKTKEIDNFSGWVKQVLLALTEDDLIQFNNKLKKIKNKS